MNGREPFGYVVTIEGPMVTLNLKDAHRGHYASHRDGVSPVTEISGLFGVDGGTRLLVMRVRSLSFAEPKEAHSAGIGSTSIRRDPLRNVVAVVVGTISRSHGELRFTPDSLVSPTLGAEAYPLSQQEFACVLRTAPVDGPSISLGCETRGGGSLQVGLSNLLGRHVAVLGATGQGKSCFTAAVLQRVLRLPSPRIVVFDINGEYGDALTPHASGPGECVQTTIGGGGFKIPYYALGRHGLSRLLLPSEKTQRPALAFALENLQFVRWFPGDRAAGLVQSTSPDLFDDCRPGDATDAWNAIDVLRRGAGHAATAWPHMGALACLAAESHALKRSKDSKGTVRTERDAFHYSNVAPLITRIRRCIEDPLFASVVDVDGGLPSATPLSWHAEGAALVERIFGGPSSDWKLHIVNLRHVAHDLMPLVLGSLLELFAFELFRRGQTGGYPTLLVLEEAHHYLRQITEQEDGTRQALAYERLAKEGRKFGLGLWISTQRPAEVSTTVLAQCGTWVVFRLTSEVDLKAVSSAGEWVDRHDISRIAGLPRRQALVFGSSVALPVRVEAPEANPVPRSADPDFDRWAAARVSPPPDPAAPGGTPAAIAAVATEGPADDDVAS